MATTQMNKPLEMALHYSQLGYRVFPCIAGSKAPLTPNGFKDASDDEEIIRAWFNQNPSANVAIPTEGLLVIDIDSKAPSWPDAGKEFPACPLALTPRGGRHYVFRQTDGRRYRNTVKELAPDVDTRGDGGYILVSPSRTSDGVYAWAETLELCERSRLPPIPEWLDQELDALKTRKVSAPVIQGNDIPDGARNSTLASLAGSMRRVGMTEQEILAAISQANTSRCKPPLPERDVRKICESIARYEPDQRAVALAEGHFDQLFESEQDEEPKPPPEEILRVPGFIGEVMDHTLASAPYPNVTLAFVGAMALLATLTGRKICDVGDNRTNLYLLALANAGAGKDFPRKVNIEVMHAIGKGTQIGTSFASGEGIQDALMAEPCKLFQTDEIDALINCIASSGGKDIRYENIMQTLLMMFSSANSIFSMRSKANQDSSGAIVQPHLVLFGTAIPVHYYGALSERMLTNGFFARMLVFEATKRGEGQLSRNPRPPDSIIQQAKWWADLNPSKGNLEGALCPDPITADYSNAGEEVAKQIRKYCDKQYAKHDDNTIEGAAGAAVWGRAFENISKMALLYAASENNACPIVTDKALNWAAEIVNTLIARTLWMVRKHSGQGEFEVRAQKILTAVKAAGKGGMPRWKLAEKVRIQPKLLDEAIASLVDRRRMSEKQVETGGRPSIVYFA